VTSSDRIFDSGVDWYAARLRLEWSAELQARADAAGIRVHSVTPAACEDWRWGAGDHFVGWPDDPAEVVLELAAMNPLAARSRIIDALDPEGAFRLDPRTALDFAWPPELCAAARPREGADLACSATILSGCESVA
jgi:hypothetical protein